MQLFLFSCLLTTIRFIPTLLCLGKKDIPFYLRFITPLWGGGLRINLLDSSVMLIVKFRLHWLEWGIPKLFNPNVCLKVLICFTRCVWGWGSIVRLITNTGN